ncbi:DUF2252 family protein [uncultured Thiohalocapsa sp.]|uniref:DUF2252 family protein n=1 Tax=uncultured Thiohalocapsa sp. TaxID=768990 RepID=UPI0025E12F19|nr:DUF2252 family protein [uncultured Thiohalocapsa sp.]
MYTTDSPQRRDLIRAELLRVDGVDPGAGVPTPKHRKMAASPLRFLRGSAQLYYADLAGGALQLPPPLLTQVPATTVMGDCHISNFGFLTEEGSHGDTVVFCPNDYDDACMGHAVWDLARYLVSLTLAADYCRGVLDGRYAADLDDPAALTAATDDDARAAGRAFLAAYTQTCREAVADPARRDGALTHFPAGHVLRKPFKKARRRRAGGRDFATKSALAKAIERRDGRLRFRDRPDRFAALEAGRARQVRRAFRPYVDDTVLDLVLRLGAGTGSVDLERFYLLVGPQEFAGDADLPLCHLVEIKQQRPASPLYHFPDLRPENRLDPAHLTVDCQRRMQRSPDMVLDEAVWEDKHWLVRSRHHARVGIDPEDIGLAKQHPGKRLGAYAAACGEALALAHARGDRRSTRFEAAMAAVLPQQTEALLDACAGYALQHITDHRLLRALLPH